jgi:luciferase family oxidoreductase group 1
MALLSILDQSPIRSGSTAAEAIRETLDLAQAADRLGYHRYWLAEHHASRGLAGTAPEILIGQVAARTAGVRVGSGGVMLSHYSPLKVAESFRLLETLYPGRIDLGIGRAPGSDQRTAMALGRGAGGPGSDHFPGQVADLIGFLHNTLEAGHPFADVRAMPDGPGAPELWLLGSTDQSAALAAHFGTAFSFAHFINDEGGAEIARAYAQQFRPSPWLPAPRASVAVFVICADTEAEAKRLARSRDLWVLWLFTGRTAPYPTVEQAEAYRYTARERAIVEHNRRRTVAGDPEQVFQRLLGMGADHGVNEFVILTITEDFKSRARSYELLAEAFGLERRASPAP